MLFQDRGDAGRALARAVALIPNLGGAIVLALPRGGVPVGYEVACELHLPLDVLVVRKLGVPGQEELAMGAVASGGSVVLNPSVLREFGISEEILRGVREREEGLVARTELAYRDGRAPLDIGEHTAILVDDGMATGATMRAAVRSVRAYARRVIVAVPVAATFACNNLAGDADQVACANVVEPFTAVSMSYRDFQPVTDDEVRALLKAADHCTHDAQSMMETDQTTTVAL